MMRTRTMTLLASLVLLLLAIYLRPGGVRTDTKDEAAKLQQKAVPTSNLLNNIFYYNNGASPNIEAFVKLMEQLRTRLASGTVSHGIAVTRSPRSVVPLQERFIEVRLENNDGEVITVIIDTLDVYVIGYLVCSSIIDLPTFHYLTQTNPATQDALNRVFPSTHYTHNPLGFAGDYGSLPSRETREIGHIALNEAIRDLHYGYTYSQKSAMLVIIQMLSEAVRIRYMEHLILRNMLQDNLNFRPDARARSMEERWSDLSEQIQCSGESGVFLTEIEVRSVSNDVVLITNVVQVMRIAALALILYRPNHPNAIRMPVPIAVGADEQCPYGEPVTNIIGRDGLCASVKDNHYNNGNHIISWKCGNAQPNQLWTFKSDGTIRSCGKCLTTSGYYHGVYIIIHDCDTAELEATQWILYNAGTIMNPKSGLVIAAESYTQGTMLTVERDDNSTIQAWSAGNYTQDTINYISGFGELCLQSNGRNAHVSLENCVIGTEPRQQWVFYGDNTIRLYSDPTGCLTSNGVFNIMLFTCMGWDKQRWTFMADGTILNPYIRLVMDVKQSDVSLKAIILFRPTGNPSQKWLAF